MYKKLREKHVDLAMMLSTCVEFIVMNVSSSSSESSEEKLKEEVKMMKLPGPLKKNVNFNWVGPCC